MKKPINNYKMDRYDPRHLREYVNKTMPDIIISSIPGGGIQIVNKDYNIIEEEINKLGKLKVLLPMNFFNGGTYIELFKDDYEYMMDFLYDNKLIEE